MECDSEQLPPHRYISTENIHAGDIILEEEPWTWSFFCLHGEFFNDGPDHMVCHYCLSTPDKLLACSACKSAWYCGSTCQRADWTLRHKYGDCRMQKNLTQMQKNMRNKSVLESLHEVELRVVVRRLLMSAASARLFSAKQHDSDGNPISPLWQALLNGPSKTDDWVDLNRKLRLDEDKPILPGLVWPTAQPVYTDLVRMISWKDLPNKLIEKRILPSLVLLRNYGPWMKSAETMQIPTEFQNIAEQVAIGACLEMSKFPNNCNPNAVVINEGRVVRMIALENIPNLDAVRLARMPAWRFETRYTRRTGVLRGVYGYDCYCARCCAGDSGETTLFALRCPKWAALYDVEKFDDSNCSSPAGCDGIVTGLRRTDVEHLTVEYMTSYHGAEVAAVIDEPRPLPEEIANKPAHERAECQKCHAHYDEKTFETVVRTLNFMSDTHTYGSDFSRSDEETRQKCTEAAVKYGEKYLYPTNYIYIIAKQIIFGQSMMALRNGVRLEDELLAFLRRNARQVLERVETENYKQMDLLQLFHASGFHAFCVKYMKKGFDGDDAGKIISSDAEVKEEYKETADLFIQVATEALKKLRVLLVHE